MALRNGRTTAAIQTILVGSVHPTGAGIPYFGSTAPEGWVLASGKTIGNASSGGTERANDDTYALFELLWNSYSNTILAIQDSTGVASTRGASALADFNANKRLPTLDLRGRVPVGKDDMGGTAASRMTSAGSGVDGATLGSSGGAQTHTLITAELAVHTHVQNSHNHVLNANTNSGASYNASTNSLRTGQTATSTTFPSGTLDAATATNQNAGSGTAHNNTQPTIISNYLLKL
jgi:microcystin-dependent protein